jgi:hypothetical protein
VKKMILAATMLAACCDIFAMDIPQIDLSVPWQDREKFFDIVPVYESRIAELQGPHAKAFVEHIVNAEIAECADLAELYFQTRNDEDSKKCMDLLMITGGWPFYCGQDEATRKICGMYNADEVMSHNFEYGEFCGDVLYMGLYRTFKRKSDGTVDLNAFDETKADFFRELSERMYDSAPNKNFDDRKHDFFVCYTEAPEWYPNVVWLHWLGIYAESSAHFEEYAIRICNNF